MKKVKISFEDILDCLKEGENFKLVVDQTGEAYFLPEDAQESKNIILIQNFEIFDLEDAGSEENYKLWLECCFMEQLEAKNGELIQIELS